MSYNTLSAFIGVGKESTYGTPVAATSFLEFGEGGDSLKLKAGRIAKPTLRSASSMRSVKAKKSAEGGVKVPMFLPQRNFSLNMASAVALLVRCPAATKATSFLS
jgi:hypothetical protein